MNTLRFFDIGTGLSYFDDALNKDITQRVASRCYLPTNALILRLIRKHPRIKVCYSISGMALQQFEQYAPEVLTSFRALVETGSVELFSETYHHSLACLMPGNEFALQVAKHQKEILRHFGVIPQVFRNTELIYNDELGTTLSGLGFRGTVIDGIERVLEHRSPHHVFQHPEAELKILTRNYRLSDDVSFRFVKDGKKLTPEQYITWITGIPAQERTVTLAMDYETFGEHQPEETGIFTFLESFLSRVACHPLLTPLTASEAMEGTAHSALAVPAYVSWADQERDLSAWLGNEMQRDAFDTLLGLENDVKNRLDKTLLRQWRALQTSDHFYYMSTKRGSDGGVHSYFSPYPSPYEAFINYMNVLTDLSMRTKVSDTVLPVTPTSEVLLT